MKAESTSRVRHCNPSACPLYIFVPLLSIMRVLMPQRAIHVAAIRPAGPAPTMRTSTSECPGAMRSLIT